MSRFLLGMTVGLVLGFAGTALAARMVGSSEYLLGWTVSVGGEEVCSDPYVWVEAHEIECD